MSNEKRHPLIGRGLRLSASAPVDGSVLIYDSSTGKWVPHTPPEITGSRGGNAALADLLTELETLGLIVDNTTA
jgi:hypothetical protein